MGGNPPLGCDAHDRKPVVNEEEAATVRRIFRLYRQIRSVRELRHRLDAEGITSKRRVMRDGSVTGGKPINRGTLYHPHERHPPSPRMAGSTRAAGSCRSPATVDLRIDADGRRLPTGMRLVHVNSATKPVPLKGLRETIAQEPRAEAHQNIYVG